MAILKSRLIIIAAIALTLGYVGAGAPSVFLLLKPSVIEEGIALKAITYHGANPADSRIPQADLAASRFYVLLIALASLFAGVVAFRPRMSKANFLALLGVAASLLLIFVYAQFQAFYTVG